MAKKDPRRAKITPETQAESVALLKIWIDKKGTATQASFGEEYGIGSQAAVGHFLNGKTPLSLKAAKGFAKGLNCKISDFSPRLAEQVADTSAFATKTKAGPLSFLDLNRTEADLIGTYRELSPEQRKALMEAARDMASKRVEQIEREEK